MGRFVGNMTDDALLACFAVIDSPTLLRISYFVEEKDQLDHVVGLLEIDRVREAIRLASEEDLWPQALDLLTRVSPERAGALADLAAEEEDLVLDGMVARGAARRPVGRRPAGHAEHERRGPASASRCCPPSTSRTSSSAIVDAASADDLMDDLLPLAALMPDDARQAIADHAPTLLDR